MMSEAVVARNALDGDRSMDCRLVSRPRRVVNDIYRVSWELGIIVMLGLVDVGEYIIDRIINAL